MLAMPTTKPVGRDELGKSEGAQTEVTRIECTWGGEGASDLLKMSGPTTRQEAVAAAAAALRGEAPAVLEIDQLCGTVRLVARATASGRPSRRGSTMIMANP